MLHSIVPRFKPNWEKDRNLMKSFANSGFQGLQLAAVNMCRLYLQVIYLSDITTGDGQYISKAIYSGEIRRWSTSQYK